MKFSKNLTREFKKELLNAIRLSVFLTALVFGFLIFQNQTTSHEKIAEMKMGLRNDLGRVPASVPNTPIKK